MASELCLFFYLFREAKALTAAVSIEIYNFHAFW